MLVRANAFAFLLMRLDEIRVDAVHHLVNVASLLTLVVNVRQLLDLCRFLLLHLKDYK